MCDKHNQLLKILFNRSSTLTNIWIISYSFPQIHVKFSAGEEAGDWITPEVLGLWHYHHHTSPDLDQQLDLISKIVSIIIPYTL